MEVVGGQAAATDWSVGRNLVVGPVGGGGGGDHNTGRPAAGAGASWAAGLGCHLNLRFVRKKTTQYFTDQLSLVIYCHLMFTSKLAASQS